MRLRPLLAACAVGVVVLALGGILVGRLMPASGTDGRIEPVILTPVGASATPTDEPTATERTAPAPTATTPPPRSTPTAEPPRRTAVPKPKPIRPSPRPVDDDDDDDDDDDGRDDDDDD